MQTLISILQKKGEVCPMLKKIVLNMIKSGIIPCNARHILVE